MRRPAVALVLCGVAGFAAAGGCSVSSSGLAFGTYQTLAFPGMKANDVVTDGSLSMVCTGVASSANYSIALGSSPVGNSMIPRLMANPQGGPNLQFNVYRDPAFTMVWGDGVAAGALSGSIAAGDSSRTIPLYGRAPAGQSGLRAGAFSTTLVMTLTYNP